MSYRAGWVLGWRSGLGAALLVGRSRDRFPVVSLDFSVTYSFRPFHGPGDDSAPSENEYQKHFLGVKAAGVWGWRPHHLHVPNVMNMWEPKPPGTLWATPGLLRETFTAQGGLSSVIPSASRWLLVAEGHKSEDKCTSPSYYSQHFYCSRIFQFVCRCCHCNAENEEMEHNLYWVT
jgi:hypothetical protein